MDTILRRPPKQQRSRGRVEEILAAARKLIGEKGIADVKMREIAALAGGPISSVYQYFPNKSAILAMLFEQWAEELDSQAKARLETINTVEDFLAAASDLFDYFHRRIAEDPAMLDLLNAVQADKTLTDLDIAGTRVMADQFCDIGERFVAKDRHDDFRRATFLMFHLAFAAVRLAVWQQPTGDRVITDYKALIRSQMAMMSAPA